MMRMAPGGVPWRSPLCHRISPCSTFWLPSCDKLGMRQPPIWVAANGLGRRIWAMASVGSNSSTAINHHLIFVISGCVDVGL